MGMIRKILDLFGVVRTMIMTITLAVVAGAMQAADFSPVFMLIVLGFIVLVFWKAPFGAKFRRNF